MQKTVKNKRKQIFIGFPCTKDPNLSPQQHHIPGEDEVYHGNDDRPDDSTLVFECLVSLVSTVHSSIGNLTLSLNVILFLLCLFGYLQNALSKCGHKNARTNISKTEKRSPSFNTYEMPLVINCRCLGKGITTSVPTSVRFTRMRGPNERVATALY